LGRKPTLDIFASDRFAIYKPSGVPLQNVEAGVFYHPAEIVDRQSDQRIVRIKAAGSFC
jgi:hypothetical protein